MEPDEDLDAVVSEYVAAYQALASASAQDVAEANGRAEVAHAAYERALVARGHVPPFPPITDEGRAKWGLTLAEVDDAVVRRFDASR